MADLPKPVAAFLKGKRIAVAGVSRAKSARSWSSLANACSTRMPPTFSSIRTHLLQVLCHAGDERVRLLIAVEPEREILKMIENLAPHLGLDEDAQDVPPVVHDVMESGVEQIDRQQPRRRAGLIPTPEP